MSDHLQIRLPSTNIFFRSGLVLDRYLSVVFEINGLVRLSLRRLNRHIKFVQLACQYAIAKNIVVMVIRPIGLAIALNPK